MRINSEKLEALRRREAAVKAAIAAERVRQLKRKEKDDLHEFTLVGRALVTHARKSPDFHLMLKQVLQTADFRDGERAFLTGKGW